MYSKILIPVENAPTDQTILRHIRELARLTGASLTLLHVADGWAARTLQQLDLQDSEEMKQDRAYLVSLESELRGEGFTVASVLANGDPGVAAESGVLSAAASGLSELARASEPI